MAHAMIETSEALLDKLISELVTNMEHMFDNYAEKFLDQL
jgi:hypothetical protein